MEELQRKLVTRQAHKLKVVSSNLAPTTNKPLQSKTDFKGFTFGFCLIYDWGTVEALQNGKFSADFVN